MGKRYPSLSAKLASQLSAVPMTDNLYHPCQVALDDGTLRDRVYVVDANPWYQQWGVWPEDDDGKSFLPVERLVEIRDSPSRLPAWAADELYAAGESGMGYTIFTVRFADGTLQAVVTGNAIDFIDYPAGQSPQTVSSVLPKLGCDWPDLTNGPDYQWCLYDGIHCRK